MNLGAIGTGNLVALVKDTNGNNRIEDAEVLFKSSQSADIASVQLNAGTYYLVADLTTLPGGSTFTLYHFNGDGISDVFWRNKVSNVTTV